VAVRAQQHALARLGAAALERTRHPAQPKAKGFGRRIQMVELERADVAVVAAEDAAATGLGDQQRLDLAPARDDALLAALLATVMIQRAVFDKRREPVDRALALDRARLRAARFRRAARLDPYFLSQCWTVA
jgi:hypothetical protein